VRLLNFYLLEKMELRLKLITITKKKAITMKFQKMLMRKHHSKRIKRITKSERSISICDIIIVLL
jgi:hypothetical protein